MSGHRDNYIPGVISVTELLAWVASHLEHPEKLWPIYPPDPTHYYKKRGNWSDQVCAILAQGKHVDDATVAMGLERRRKPLVRDDAPDEDKYECWSYGITAFEDWLTRYKVEYIASQGYVHNKVEHYQGTYDLKVNILEVPSTERLIKTGITLIDFKRGDCPEGTRYQLTGYVLGDRKMEPIPRMRFDEQRIGMQLLPGKCVPHVYNDYRDYDTFRLWARTYRSLEQYR